MKLCSIIFNKNLNPTIVKEIGKLIIKYGEWGSVVCDENGIKDYNQTYCQMNRLTGEKHHRVLDFSAGKCAYANKLKNEGYNVFMYEPFFRNEKENSFDMDKIVGFIEEIQVEIKKNGLFDIVVLDSVLNSVTSSKMHHNVLLTCNSLLKEKGILILGTRSLGKAKLVHNQTKSTNAKREIEFLDDDNFSVTFRNGVWTKQRFNSKENLLKELSPYFEEVETLGNETRSNIYAICKKPVRWSLSECKNALNTEFNMTYPSGFKHNKHKKLVKTVLERLV